MNIALDPKLFPSLFYIFGLKEHRYRYYKYFPEQTPDFEYWGL